MQTNTSKQTILIVEDEVDMLRILDYNLRHDGYQTMTASTGAQAYESLAEVKPDLVILDLRLPDTFGLTILQTLKEDQRTARIPVLVVSALGDEETVVQGLNLGAEDYITKPFRVRELMARITAILRRSVVENNTDNAELKVNSIALNLDTHEALVNDKCVEFTKSEFSILEHFLRCPGRVFTRQQLCFQALHAGGAVQERTIDAHIRTIRRKLGLAGKHLVTVWGVGYKLTQPPPAE